MIPLTLAMLFGRMTYDRKITGFPDFYNEAVPQIKSNHPKSTFSMKRILMAVTLALAVSATNAQFYQSPDTVMTKNYEEEPKKGFDPNKLVFGGGFGASFGNFTFVNVSPQVGYMFNPYLTAGAGINFIYQGQKYENFSGINEDAKSNYGYAGLSVFGRVFPIRFIMLSVQPELNYNWGNVKYDNPNIPDTKIDAKFVPSLLLGGGLFLPAGRRGGTMISLQYDVIQNERSPYGSNAFVNVGFSF